MGNDFMEFQSFNMIFFIVFGLIAIVMIMGIVKTIGAGLSNQAAERVQRSCKVVDKTDESAWGIRRFFSFDILLYHL